MRTKNRLTALILILAMALSVAFTGCSMGDPEMIITIEGTEFKLDCKVSDILNAGFQLSEYDNERTIMKEYPEIPARTVIQNGLYIMKNGEAAHVEIFVYNKSVNNARFEDCNIYKFKYDCGTYAENAADDNCLTVRLCGIDTRFRDCSRVISEFEDKGLKFKSDEKEDFCREGDPYSASLVGARIAGGGFLTVFNDYNYTTGHRTVNGFEITLNVKYDTSGVEYGN